MPKTEYFIELFRFPLPPLAEQHRIVAKVDELMALCDRLEEARKTREEKSRDKLTAASLAHLTAPDTTPEDFPAHARFALEALPSLTTRPDQIKTLRQTILNLAVRGKLVEQDPADEPALHILAKISAARQKKRSVKLGNADLPFSLPAGWESASVQDTLMPGREISYGVIKLGNEPKSGVFRRCVVATCDLATSTQEWSAMFGKTLKPNTAERGLREARS